MKKETGEERNPPRAVIDRRQFICVDVVWNDGGVTSKEAVGGVFTGGVLSRSRKEGEPQVQFTLVNRSSKNAVQSKSGKQRRVCITRPRRPVARKYFFSFSPLLEPTSLCLPRRSSPAVYTKNIPLFPPSIRLKNRASVHTDAYLNSHF